MHLELLPLPVFFLGQYVPIKTQKLCNVHINVNPSQQLGSQRVFFPFSNRPHRTFDNNFDIFTGKDSCAHLARLCQQEQEKLKLTP